MNIYDTIEVIGGRHMALSEAPGIVGPPAGLLTG